MKKITVILMALVLLVTGITINPATRVDAKVTKNVWKDAYTQKYIELVKQPNKTSFKWVKMDKTSIPVLVVVKEVKKDKSSDGRTLNVSFYKYKNKKVNLIGNYKIVSLSKSSEEYSIVDKDLVFTSLIGDLGKNIKFSIVKDKVVKTVYSELMVGTEPIKYYRDKKEITKDEYMKEFKAEKNVTFKKAVWQDAYAKKLAKLKKNGKSSYAIVKMDNTKIPMLVVKKVMSVNDMDENEKKTELSFFKYKKGNVKRVAVKDVFGYKTTEKFYYRDNKLMYSCFRGDIDRTVIFSVKNGKIEINKYIELMIGTNPSEFFKNDEKITKKEYMKEFKGTKALKYTSIKNI